MNIMDILRQHTQTIPNKILYRYEEDEGAEELTIQELFDDAQGIASQLHGAIEKGERALLLYPPGLDFIKAFIGCLFAGVIAVPAYPPRKNQKIDRLKSIVLDSDARVVLATSGVSDIIRHSFAVEDFFQDMVLIQSDMIQPSKGFDIGVVVEKDDVAFLQYTSGSTGEPKGVMITHANIMSNMESLRCLVGYKAESRCVSWLPLFHDMGLMGGVLEPLYMGCEVTLMSPLFFLQKPIRWLEAISRHQADVSGGPNFAYELCLSHIKDDELEGLDLSSWKSAVNGAEPISAATLERFNEKFASCGFGDAVHYPSYGMAETTLIITGGEQAESFKALEVDEGYLKEGRVVPRSGGQSIVSCGRPVLGHEIVIRSTDGQDVGEILVKGSSIAKGYWRNERKTSAVFGEYFNTGDLGFLHEGELYVCGRAKDLIIIRGQNYYPQDIEANVYRSHEALVDTGCAAFSIKENDEGEERLVVVQEIKRTFLRKYNPQTIFEAIREAIGNEHELAVFDIVLVKPNQLLKTSSGKIQRYRNKESYLNKKFKPLATYLRRSAHTPNRISSRVNLDVIDRMNPLEQAEVIVTWIREEIGRLCQLDQKDVSAAKNFVSFGIDSLKSIELQNSLSLAFDIDIPLIWFYDYPTVVSLSQKVQEAMRGQGGQGHTRLKPLISDTEHMHDPFPLNDIQQAYLLGRDDSMVLGNTSCFAYTELWLHEKIDIQRLEKAWNKLVEHFPMMHARIDAAKMTQSIVPEVAHYSVVHEFVADVESVAKRRENRIGTIIDPAEPPLYDLKIYTLQNGERILSLYIDMLICDAASIGILLKRLRQFYDHETVESPGIDFRDYVLYKERHKETHAYKKSLAYWRERMDHFPPPPQLHFIQEPSSIEKPKFVRKHLRLNQDQWQRFQGHCSSLGSTPTSVLLACYAKTLSLWSSNHHFCINLTLFDRLQVHKDIDHVVGDFTSPSLLEVAVPREKIFANVVDDIKRQLFLDLEHKDVSGIQIQREMKAAHGSPMYPVVFTSILGLDAMDIEWMGQEHYTVSQTPQVWIDNQISEVNGELIVNWDAIEELFGPEMLDGMFAFYQKMLLQFVQDPDALDERVFYAFDSSYMRYNKTSHPISQEPLLFAFMDQVFQRQGSEAVVSGKNRLSYQQLHNGAAQLAKKIENTGVRAGDHVAILLSRGWEQIVSVLACGYAGVAYLPLSINYPNNRITYLLNEANVGLVLGEVGEEHEWSVAGNRIDTIEVSSFVDLDRVMPPYHIKSTQDSLAYTIFTSGSTGTPKGVMVTHANIANTVRDMNERFALSSEDRFFGISELNFDLSVYDIYGALSCGATIVIPTEDQKNEPSAWEMLLHKERISIWNSVPAFMQMLIAQNTSFSPCLRLVLLSGDFISTKLARDILNWAPEIDLISLGGATEGSIWSIYYPITQDALGHLSRIPYGYPLSNQEIYIMDGEQNTSPCMADGEICIAGDGVVKGYLHDPKKTQKAFFEKDSKRYYRTGDIGYFNPRGYIEIVGRMDNQVKIRGHRIELGEIEECLMAFDGVRDGIALVKNETIVAFVSTTHSISRESIMDHLAGDLPEYMLPSHIEILEKLPLNSNGKIDRKALGDMEVLMSTSENFVAPRNRNEEMLSAIFEEVLSVENVGIHDNFFELGGHSLLATKMATRIRDGFDVALPLKILFSNPTVSGLAKYLANNSSKNSVPRIIPQEERIEKPLSYAQERLLFLDKLGDGDGATYSMSALLSIKGELDSSAIKNAFVAIAIRHESLRTNFVIRGDALFQKIHDQDRVVITEISLDENQVLHHASQSIRRGFDLERDPLFEITLYQINDQTHYLLVNMHHIVSDGWSLGILVREFTTLYVAYTNNQIDPLPPLRVQYGDYAAWQKDYLSGKVLDEKLNYWIKELSNIEPLAIPATFPRPATQSNRGHHQRFQINKVSTAHLHALSKQYDATLFMTLLSLFGLLMHKYTGQDEFVVGSPVANRGHSDIEPMIGLFVNTLAIKQDFRDDMKFSTILQQTKERILGAYEHQDVPFEKIVDALDIPRDTSRSPLFQVMFVLQNNANDALELPGLTIEHVEIENPTSKFDITMEITEKNGELEGVIEYATDLFSATYIDAMIGHFSVLIESVVRDETQPTSSYPLLTQAESDQLLIEYNDTQAPYPQEKCIHQLFEEQVERLPENIAVVYEDSELTYAQLNVRANQLAHHLIGQGVGPDDLVAICVDRSLEMMVGLLAILKAGGAYVPIDPTYPRERIEHMLNDSGAKILLTQTRWIGMLPETQSHVIDMETLETDANGKDNPRTPVSSRHLAYVIYTSGSTGKPKGVMIEHRSVVALIFWAKRQFPQTFFDCTLASTSYTFDLSVFEMFVPLSLGGSALVVPNILSIIHRKTKYPITLVNTVPSAVKQLHDAQAIPQSIGAIFLAGEKLKQGVVDALHSLEHVNTVYDLYGPSEDTTYTTYAQRVLGGVETIGRPISNTQLYILDANLNPLPKGIIGELHIAGDGLARGYLNRPTLTSEKFIPNPFSSEGKLYKTGDLARYMDDGNIEYIGRADEQVKIRGFRIELGEIEQQLLSIRAIKECVVLAKENGQEDKVLVTYMTLQQGEEISISAIKGTLSQHLPDYMIPMAYEVLEEMPLTPNGKIDKKTLAALEVVMRSTKSYVAPRNQIEEKLAAIFSEILGVEQVGVYDNFFELGGHSLLAMKLVSKVRSELEIELPLRELFGLATLEELGEKISLMGMLSHRIDIDDEDEMDEGVI